MSTFALLATVWMLLSAGDQTPEDWRKQHRVGNTRYEGVGFRTRQSAPAILDLVSFLTFKEKFDGMGPAELSIEFFRSRAEVDSVVARELIPIKHYRMEAIPPSEGWRPGWNHFVGWSTRDVLDPEHIPLSKLGVLIRLKADDGLRVHVAPAVLRKRDSKITAPLTHYEAHFVSSVYLTGGSYEVFRGCDETAPRQPIRTGIVGTQRANIAFPVVFQLDAAAPGPYRLKVEVTERRPKPTTTEKKTVAPVSREYCFSHQPRPSSN